MVKEEQEIDDRRVKDGERVGVRDKKAMVEQRDRQAGSGQVSR